MENIKTGVMVKVKENLNEGNVLAINMANMLGFAMMNHDEPPHTVEAGDIGKVGTTDDESGACYVLFEDGKAVIQYKDLEVVEQETKVETGYGDNEKSNDKNAYITIEFVDDGYGISTNLECDLDNADDDELEFTINHLLKIIGVQ